MKVTNRKLRSENYDTRFTKREIRKWELRNESYDLKVTKRELRSESYEVGYNPNNIPSKITLFDRTRNTPNNGGCEIFEEVAQQTIPIHYCQLPTNKLYDCKVQLQKIRCNFRKIRCDSLQ